METWLGYLIYVLSGVSLNFHLTATVMGLEFESFSSGKIS